jgi:hypothetical protein
MKRWMVVLHGTNALLRRDGADVRGGFYVHRVVSAPDEESAARLAVQEVFEDETVLDRLVNSEDDPAVLRADQVQEVAAGVEAVGETTYYVDEP